MTKISIDRTVIFRLCLISMLASSCFQEPCRGATVSGWSINQTHRYFGRVNLVLSPDGILIRSLDTDISGICLKPTWKCMGFSDKRRIAQTSDLNKTARGFLYNMYSDCYESKPGNRQSRGRINYAGQSVRVVGSDCYNLQGRLVRNPESNTGEYILSKNFNLPQQINEFVCKFYDLTPLDETPLKVVNYGRAHPYGMGLKYNKPRSAYVVLETIGNIAPLSSPPKMAYPVGYKEVDINIITFGQKTKEIESLKTLFGEE